MVPAASKRFYDSKCGSKNVIAKIVLVNIFYKLFCEDVLNMYQHERDMYVSMHLFSIPIANLRAMSPTFGDLSLESGEVAPRSCHRPPDSGPPGSQDPGIRVPDPGFPRIGPRDPDSRNPVPDPKTGKTEKTQKNPKKHPPGRTPSRGPRFPRGPTSIFSTFCQGFLPGKGLKK